MRNWKALVWSVAVAVPLGAEPGSWPPAVYRHVEAVQQARRQIQLEQHQHEENMATADRRLQRLKSQHAEANDEAATLAAQLRDKQAELAAADVNAATNRQRINDAVKAAVAATSSMEYHVRRGIPFRREQRLNMLSQIREQLSGDTLSQLAGLRAWFTFLSDEIAEMNTIEMASVPVELDADRQKFAYRIRFGLTNAVFMTEDGADYGVAAREAGRNWVMASDPEIRQRIRRSRDILRQMRVPGLEPVPVVIIDASVEEGQ